MKEAGSSKAAVIQKKKERSGEENVSRSKQEEAIFGKDDKNVRGAIG
jgi:hypothetical protein